MGITNPQMDQTVVSKKVSAAQEDGHPKTLGVFVDPIERNA